MVIGGGDLLNGNIININLKGCAHAADPQITHNIKLYCFMRFRRSGTHSIGSGSKFRAECRYFYARISHMDPFYAFFMCFYVFLCVLYAFLCVWVFFLGWPSKAVLLSMQFFFTIFGFCLKDLIKNPFKFNHFSKRWRKKNVHIDSWVVSCSKHYEFCLIFM